MGTRIERLTGADVSPEGLKGAIMEDVGSRRFCVDMKEDTDDENWVGVTSAEREGNVYAVFDKLCQREVIMNVSFERASAIVSILNLKA